MTGTRTSLPFALRALSLAAAILIPGCLADPTLKLDDQHVPIDRGDGWVISSPTDQGVSSAGLDHAYREFFATTKYRTAISMLVVRNGVLIGEGYCRDRGDYDVRTNIKSCTKSFTSLLTGIAIDRGLIDSTGDRVSKYLPEFFAPGDPKGNITLEHALTMMTGLRYTNDDDNEDLLVDPPPSSLEYFLKGDLEFQPGERFHYSDAPPHLVGAAIARRAGTSLDRFADSTLFGPLGITDYLWEKHRDGLCYGAFGIYMKPRDLAKVGQLCLQKGIWKGKTIVPSAWLDRSLQTHAWGAIGPYGFYWWLRPAFGAYTMEGHGGNFVYVIPAKQMVIVFTAIPFVDGDIAITTDRFEDLVAILVAAVN